MDDEHGDRVTRRAAGPLWARQELAVPKVSIVIPVYNRVPLLIECLKSVRAQSFEDYEVIVVDDGSTEDVKQAVSPFRVRYVRQEQQGPPGAYNKIGKHTSELQSRLHL